MSDATSGKVPEAPAAVEASAIPVVPTVTLVAGSDTQGGVVDGIGSQARFSLPHDLAVDSAGNVYVAELSSRIRKLAPSGEVTTFAVLPKTSATGIAVDSAGNVYVKASLRLYKIRPTGEQLALAGGDNKGAADGQGSEAAFDFQGGLGLDTSGNAYVADFQNHRIRRVSPSGLVSTIAGSDKGFSDGASATAQFYFPGDAAMDSKGDIYVADYLNARVRKLAGATVTTFAGSDTRGTADGVGGNARFRGPRGIAVDQAGNVYVAELSASGSVRRITPAGAVTTLATGIPYARSVTVDASGTVYVGNGDSADRFVGAIRKITSVGIGELKVTWQAPSSERTISGYVATATATGYDSVTCSSSGETMCTLRGLVSGVAYDVAVTAASDAGTSEASVSARATPN